MSVGATVTTQGGQGPPRPFGRTWSFTTGVLDNAVRITSTSASGRVVRVGVASDAPGATVVATGPGPTTSAAVVGQTATLNLGANGTWQICASSGGGATPNPAPPDSTTVPARVRHGKAIKVAITSNARFKLRVRAYAKGGRTLARYPAHSLASGSWSFRFSIRSPYNRAGRKVHLTFIVSTKGKTYTRKKLLRFT